MYRYLVTAAQIYDILSEPTNTSFDFFLSFGFFLTFLLFLVRNVTLTMQFNHKK